MTHFKPPIKDAKQKAYLEALALTGVVKDACAAVPVDRSTVYRWREGTDGFKEAEQDALKDAADRIEREAFRRAVEGYDEPVIYQGTPTYLYVRDDKGDIVFDIIKIQQPDDKGVLKTLATRRPRLLLDANGNPQILTVRKHSDSLLTTLLKGHLPDKYRENVKMDLNAKVQLNQMSDEEIKAELAALAASGIVALESEPDDCSDLV